MSKLWLLRKKLDGKIYYLTKELTVGRYPSADIICYSKFVTKKTHATFKIVTDNPIIINNSKHANGVYVNGIMIEDKFVLCDGDIIGVGNNLLSSTREDNIFELYSMPKTIDLNSDEDSDEALNDVINSNETYMEKPIEINSDSGDSSDGGYTVFKDGWDIGLYMSD